MNYYDLDRRGKNGNKKKKEEQRVFEQPKQLPFSITVGDSITVKELAEKLKKTSADVIKKLLSYGVMAIKYNKVNVVKIVVWTNAPNASKYAWRTPPTITPIKL